MGYSKELKGAMLRRLLPPYCSLYNKNIGNIIIQEKN